MGVQVVKVVDDLLGQEVDRKRFLIQSGGVVLALVGVSGVLKALTEAPKPSSRLGYGSGNYGGERKLGRINRRLS